MAKCAENARKETECDAGLEMGDGPPKSACRSNKVDVIRLVLNRSMAAALMGVAAGMAASFGLTRFLTGLLFEVKPMDPLILGSSALILASVAFVACYLPARRATKVNPIVALRAE